MNEQPRGKPRGIKDRNPQELSSKPRILHKTKMKNAGQAAGYSSSRESGINLTSTAQQRSERDKAINL
jgi:hypothetical protein